MQATHSQSTLTYRTFSFSYKAVPAHLTDKHKIMEGLPMHSLGKGIRESITNVPQKVELTVV